jgi:mycofactocin precursor
MTSTVTETPVADETVETVETVEQDGKDSAVLDELLVEEISIDGMCGVY